MRFQSILFINSIYIVILFEMITNQYFNNENSSNQACQGLQQSPIDFPLNSSNYIHDNETFLMNTYYSIITSPKFEKYDNSPKIGYSNDRLGYVIFSVKGVKYKYDAKEILFHIPSEHTIGNVSASLELQVVHTVDSYYYSTNNTNNVSPLPKIMANLIISILFVKRGEHISEILRSFDNFRQIINTNDISIHREKPFYSRNLSEFSLATNQDYNASTEYNILNLNKIVKTNRMYYYYLGSNTTNPCNEDVNWLILDYFYSISTHQLHLLQDYMKKYYPGEMGNARSIKALNNRKLYKLYNNNYKINIGFSFAEYISPINIFSLIFIIIF